MVRKRSELTSTFINGKILWSFLFKLIERSKVLRKKGLKDGFASLMNEGVPAHFSI